MIIPTTGMVYVDAQILIYSVERHPIYSKIIQRLWDAVQARQAEVITSKLSILECLVVPLRNGDTPLVGHFESLFAAPELQFEEISEEILRRATELRRATRAYQLPMQKRTVFSRMIGDS